jgi:AcrR family transcriptional regulator
VARLTRIESRAQTRASIVAAAADAFAARGFHGASLEEIADAAGYSRGAVYSNFADKTELFLAVFDERMHRRRHQIASLLREAKTPTDFFAALDKLNASEDREVVRQWYMLNLEFWLFAIRNPEAQHRLAEREQAIRAGLTQAIDAVYGSLGVQAPIPSDEMAIIVNALDHGLPYQELLDPDATPPGFTTKALQHLLEAGVALSKERSRATR